jgi:NADH-quinone oxidoreductase subunit M
MLAWLPALTADPGALEGQAQGMLLSLTIFAPALGALAILFLPGRMSLAIKWLSLVATGVSLVGAILISSRFDGSSTALQFVERASWIQAFNIEYFVAVDGVSVTMVLLSALTAFISIIASWNFEEWKVNHGLKGYFILILLLSTGMTGVFCALDFFLFYVFWEVVLLPMYFLIGIWGGPRREYAAIKFFLYTLAGSVLMLVVMLAMYFTSEPHTFDITVLQANGKTWFTGGWWKAAFVALYIGFAIKIPAFPFHTWLPDAHVEAPTPVSVILAAVLLKMGTYGLMRISLPILPEASYWFAPFMMLIGVVGIVYGAFCSMAQIRGVKRVNPKTGEEYIERDLKKLVAYSSVSHMGYCMIGLATATPAGLTGCLFEMWNHGIITGALFLLVGVVYDRAHHRNIDGFGGLWAQMPYYGGLTGLMFMASLGLPGLSGFISEALCFLGAFQASDPGATYFGLSFVHGAHYWKIMTAVSVSGVVLGAGYFLWSYQKIFLGPLNEKYRELPDINLRELVMLVPLSILTVVLGIRPGLLLGMIEPSMRMLSEQIGMPWVK